LVIKTMNALRIFLTFALLALSLPAQAAHDAALVRGSAELTPAAAFASAQDAAADYMRQIWRERGERIAREVRPVWLPVVVCEREVERFLESQDPRAQFAVVDREDRVREHEFGASYQTTLWVAENEGAAARGERKLRARVAALRTHAIAFLGGTAAWWAALAFLVGWFDRLSRGYMTARLLFIASALGLLVPSLAFLL
jgi:hypothetical protein